MSGHPSLLETVRDLLERTYRMRSDLGELGRFVVGDLGLRSLYRDTPVSERLSLSPGARGARTLVRETDEGVRACIYYPNALIRCLEDSPPQAGLRDANVDAFAVLVEELDHLLCIAERAREARPVSLFELELHANVSKYLVLSRFLAGSGRPLGVRKRIWLRYNLFEKASFCDADPEVRSRYREAVRWAVKLLDSLQRLRPERRIEELRAFHSAAVRGKLRIIAQIAR